MNEKPTYYGFAYSESESSQLTRTSMTECQFKGSIRFCILAERAGVCFRQKGRGNGCHIRHILERMIRIVFIEFRIHNVGVGRDFMTREAMTATSSSRD